MVSRGPRNTDRTPNPFEEPDSDNVGLISMSGIGEIQGARSVRLAEELQKETLSFSLCVQLRAAIQSSVDRRAPDED